PSETIWRGGMFRRDKAKATPPTEEQRLLRVARRGDRAAFSTIIETHQRAIFGYLRARLPDSTDAEDLCQEVFLRLYLGRAKLSHKIILRPWLIGIARNLLREHVRKLRRRKEVAWTELCLEMEEMVSTNEQSYEEVVSHLPLCIESLGQSARQALDLRYQGKLRLAEIATRFKRSEGAVKLLMFRARQALKRCLDAKVFGLKPAEEA
ncbi:MAG: sigma-70 family RNA polymerase sigma factor, partial [Patescibacteria group bacterium]